MYVHVAVLTFNLLSTVLINISFSAVVSHVIIYTRIINMKKL